MKLLAILALLFSMSSLADTAERSDPFLGGYCSAYTEEGEWSISFGRQDKRFHCNLVQHDLVVTGSPIHEIHSGWYDWGDMNKVNVRCQDEEHSFQMNGHGRSIIERAMREAEYRGGTHCLFKIKPHF